VPDWKTESWQPFALVAAVMLIGTIILIFLSLR
jgi:hypothetical protein